MTHDDAYAHNDANAATYWYGVTLMAYPDPGLPRKLGEWVPIRTVDLLPGDPTRDAVLEAANL